MPGRRWTRVEAHRCDLQGVECRVQFVNSSSTGLNRPLDARMLDDIDVITQDPQVLLTRLPIHPSSFRSAPLIARRAVHERTTGQGSDMLTAV